MTSLDKKRIGYKPEKDKSMDSSYKIVEMIKEDLN